MKNEFTKLFFGVLFLVIGISSCSKEADPVIEELPKLEIIVTSDGKVVSNNSIASLDNLIAITFNSTAAAGKNLKSANYTIKFNGIKIMDSSFTLSGSSHTCFDSLYIRTNGTYEFSGTILGVSGNPVTQTFTLNAVISGFLASNIPSNRMAVLEEFTGVRGPYCPAAHIKAKSIYDANPGKIIVLAIHGGVYASPTAGWPDYTTPQAAALITQSQLNGFPAGTMNRLPASQLGVSPMITGGTAMNDSYWSQAANVLMAKIAPVNIGINAIYNAATKTADIRVDMCYTMDENVANKLNVIIVQDGIVGKQEDNSSTPTTVTNYIQNNVVRSFVTGTGDALGPNFSKGGKLSKTYQAAIPLYYNAAGADGGGVSDITKMRVIAFITRGTVDILNAAQAVIQ